MKNFKRLLASFVTVLTLLAITPVVAHAEWKQDSYNRWWYSNGNSWYTGWQKIGGNWYYFDSEGYMLHNTIKDGYFLDNNGSWSYGDSEVQEYIKLLNDIKWQKENGIMYLRDNIVKDVNRDGSYEMLLNNGTSLASWKVSVVSYNNGNIKVDNIPSDHGGYYGYINDENVLCVAGSTQGAFYGAGYRFENNTWKKVYSWNSNEYPGRYELNDNSVSKDKFYQFMDKINK